MALLFVFVDGIGLGTAGPHNPFDGAALSLLSPLAGRGARPPAGWTLRPLDAAMGVPGLPQSATGTASLLTGLRVPALMGEHQWAFPNAEVRALLEEHSILRNVRDAGLRTRYLNGFTPERAVKKEQRGACTVAAQAGGGELCLLDAVEQGRAALFDLTHEVARGLGVPVGPRTMREAARAVARGAQEVELGLFELFLTDKAGHAQDLGWARREAQRTEDFLLALARELDPARDTVVVASDHGNLEDLSTRGHTEARVPCLSWGYRAEELTREWRDLADVGAGLRAEALARGRTVLDP